MDTIILGSIEDRINDLLAHHYGRDCESWHKDVYSILPVFESEEERKKFEQYAVEHWDKVIELKDKMVPNLFPFTQKVDWAVPNYVDDYKDQAMLSMALKQLLMEFRNESDE